MLEIFEKLVTILTTDSTLNTIVPVSNIYVGPVDVLIEQKKTLTYPAITMSLVSEGFRSVPLSTRDTMIQVDLWSFVSQMQIEQIYERVATLLNYYSGDQSAEHTFWEKISSSADQYESDRRLWHRSITLTVWSHK